MQHTLIIKVFDYNLIIIIYNNNILHRPMHVMYQVIA